MKSILLAAVAMTAILANAPPDPGASGLHAKDGGNRSASITHISRDALGRTGRAWVR